jgi:hypothetical protein
MRCFFCALISAILLAWSADHASALDRQTCARYAKGATEAAARAKENHCGFDFDHDPRWSLQPGGHADWCLGVADKDTLLQEDNERTERIARCAACNRYADQAVAAAKELFADQCFPGFKLEDLDDEDRARWDENREGHFQWCMGLSYASFQQATDAERRARDSTLNQCRYNRRDAIAYCNQYVDSTRASARTYARLNCDNLDKVISAGATAEDDETRFSWCMATLVLKYSAGYGKTNSEYYAEKYATENEFTPTKQALEKAALACRLKKALNEKRNGRAAVPKLPKIPKTYPIDRGLSGKSRASGDAAKQESSNSGSGRADNPSVEGATPSSKLLAPGLLGGDRGLARQNPAAPGTLPPAPRSGNVYSR